MVILQEDHDRFVAILEHVRREANANFAFLIDKAGQSIASAGSINDSDPTSLASLTAGNVAATEGLAQVIGESSFSTLYHEGERDCLYISLVSNRIILLVIFDEKSSLGLVRLRVRQRSEELSTVVQEVMDRSRNEPAGASVATAGLDDISDEDIDALFG
jgi:predicted regulator of Ras-like GTPase activity (Roadblock/LC7/MglB family)